MTLPHLHRDITSQDSASGNQPWYFTRADREPMTLAGLWDEWKDKATGKVLKSCTMLITDPNDFVAEVHAGGPRIQRFRVLAQGWRTSVAQTRGERSAATLAGVEARASARR
jgi:putative SOS response-associated peptidase YedK